MDEADGVDEQGFAAVRKMQHPHGWIQSGEKLVFDMDVCGGKAVHESRFSRVRIADQSDGRVGYLGSAVPMQAAGSRHLFEALAQGHDPLSNAAAIDFQLGLSGAARTDTSAQPRQVLPMAGQARQEVLELGQLDLQLARLRTSTPGEDIQDELSSIDDFDVEPVLEIPLLRRSELVVENYECGPDRLS